MFLRHFQSLICMKNYIVGLFAFLFAGCAGFEGHPLSKETIRDLFGEDIACSLIESRDFLGPDIHGELFLFYEYNLSSLQMGQLVEKKTFKKYPHFNSGYFGKVRLDDLKMAITWRHFPIHDRIDSLIFRSTFSNFQVEREMGERHSQDSSNYYCCICAKPVGNCFFILVPGTNKLYMVIRNAG